MTCLCTDGAVPIRLKAVNLTFISSTADFGLVPLAISVQMCACRMYDRGFLWLAKYSNIASPPRRKCMIKVRVRCSNGGGGRHVVKFIEAGCFVLLFYPFLLSPPT